MLHMGGAFKALRRGMAGKGKGRLTENLPAGPPTACWSLVAVPVAGVPVPFRLPIADNLDSRKHLHII